MSWTNGTWADVAIGDTVLGGDGYPWSVTDGLIDRFDVYGKGEVLRVTMQRDGAGSRTGDVLASKAVKYEPFELPDPDSGETYYVRRILSCVYCLRSDVEERCKLHAPVDREALACALTCDTVSVCNDAGRCLKLQAPDPDDAGLSELHADSAYQGEADLPAAPKVAPYVEYDESERAAASALKGAGLTMTVIERVMTLDGLLEHLDQIHHVDLPQTGTLTRIEYRSRLADLHFELHAHDQERGQKWQPRGRTPHVHPVMDRPTEDATPKSLTRSLTC